MRWSFTPLLAAFAGPLALLAGAAQAQGPPAPNCHGQPSPYRLLIDVEGVRNNRGAVVANIYGPDKQKFLADNGWLYVWDDPAQRGMQTVCVYLPRGGTYEVVMFHDANGNGVLDQGIFGVPIEAYGFSNNVRPHFRAPSMSSAAFPVSEGDTHLRIRLHYP